MSNEKKTFTPLEVENSWGYCRFVLPKVSRTFALNISVLSGDLYKTVLLGYLVCRFLDTIEDDPDLSGAEKVNLLNRTYSIFKNENFDAIPSFLKDMSKVSGKEFELDLISNTKTLLIAHKSLPENLKKTALSTYKEMAEGMGQFSKRFDPENGIILKDLKDLEDYCYYVAGTVGKFLKTSFCTYYQIDDKTAKELEKYAVSFGLGLQMTNISKDIMQDRKRGWTYLPNSILNQVNLTREEFVNSISETKSLAALDLLIEEARKHLNNAFKFTITISPLHLRLRLFCLWPLWMAMKTLGKLKGNYAVFSSEKDVKISRKDVKIIIFLTTLMAPFNYLLKASFTKLNNGIIE